MVSQSFHGPMLSLEVGERLEISVPSDLMQSLLGDLLVSPESEATAHSPELGKQDLRTVVRLELQKRVQGGY